VLFYYSKLVKNIASLTVLLRCNDDSWLWLTFWATLYMIIKLQFTWL